MRDAIKHLQEIHGRVSKNGCVLLLDFDGVLSPIVTNPYDATISPHAEKALTLAAKQFPVAIISGRSLTDLRKRAAVRGVVYAGAHGSEWRLGRRNYRYVVPPSVMRTFKDAKRVLTRVSRAYPQLVREKRFCSFALTYRLLTPKQLHAFRHEARLALGPYLRRGLRLMDSNYTFEIVANAKWTKGDCALLLYKAIKGRDIPKRVPIYIGDSLTDEDAFKALNAGITIRVGKKSGSAARYYFRSRAEVDVFLNALTSRTKSR